MSDVMDTQKIEKAIAKISQAIGGLTVAEAIHAVRSVDVVLKAQYPEAYDFMANLAKDAFANVDQD